jgi:aminoglycoside 3-N-acetyltransferase
MTEIDGFDISQAIHDLGVIPGDTLMIHSDMRLLAQTGLANTSDKCELLLKALINVLGPEGTLVVPTFSYSATSGEVYSKKNSPSKVGMFTEYFRNYSGVDRSEDPIFSLACYGRNAGIYANAKYTNSFGKNSSFDILFKNNAWLICLGCSFVVTFIHFVEQECTVPYRYLKKFDALIDKCGVISKEQVEYYVRDYYQPNEVNWPILRQKLKHDGVLKSAEIGRMAIYGLRAQDLYRYCSELLKQDPKALLFLNGNDA